MYILLLYYVNSERLVDQVGRTLLFTSCELIKFQIYKYVVNDEAYVSIINYRYRYASNTYPAVQSQTFGRNTLPKIHPHPKKVKKKEKINNNANIAQK